MTIYSYTCMYIGNIIILYLYSQQFINYCLPYLFKIPHRT